MITYQGYCSAKLNSISIAESADRPAARFRASRRTISLQSDAQIAADAKRYPISGTANEYEDSGVLTSKPPWQPAWIIASARFLRVSRPSPFRSSCDAKVIEA